MKLALATFLVLGFSTSANASGYKKFKTEALELLTAVQTSGCEVTLSNAMVGANFIQKAEAISSQAIDGQYEDLVITTAMRYPMPSGHVEPIARLTVRKVAFKKDQRDIPDYPTVWTKSCHLERLQSGN